MHYADEYLNSLADPHVRKILDEIWAMSQILGIKFSDHGPVCYFASGLHACEKGVCAFGAPIKTFARYGWNENFGRNYGSSWNPAPRMEKLTLRDSVAICHPQP